MIFETERLSVRKLRTTDITDFHKMQSNIAVMQYITGKAATYTESKEKLKLFIDRYETKTMEWPFAIVLKSTTNFVGICGIIEHNEIGYRFTPEYWRQGFATEILEGLIIYAKKLKLKNLIAEVIIANVGSYKVLKNAGFVIQKEQLCKHTNLPEYSLKLEL